MEISYSNFEIDKVIYGDFEVCGLIDIDSNYIYNNFYDIKKMTFGSNISVNRFLYGIVKSPREKIIDDMINDLEFDKSFLKKKMGVISSGELIKVLTIKLLTSDAKVIFLEHIDAYLSSKDLSKLLRMCRNYSKELTKNIIFKTSKVDNIIPDCERYIIVENNHIIYNGKDINELPIKSEITKFVEAANRKKAGLDNYKDVNDLLKAIYRSVKK